MAVALTSARSRTLLWSAWVVLGLLLLPVGAGGPYLTIVAVSALAVGMVPGALPPLTHRRDLHDLAAIAVSYIGVVGLNALAFLVFSVENVTGLFLCFAASLLLGTAGPLFYTGWVRGRPLRGLGLHRDNLRGTALLALAFAGVQFGLTLWGYDLPAAVNWVPLLCMSLVVGVFESVFFRGFIQNTLERQLGPRVGIGAAAALYGAYHVGYGMSGADLLFLTGLGVVYAVAFAIARNLLVLWPLLTPLGSFYANLNAGDIELPWVSIAGFADVVGLMVLAWWLTVRHERRSARRHPPGTPAHA
jgi:membrane protease YdiL (CAAX protease family)